MNEVTIISLMFISLIASGIGVALWKPKAPNTDNSDGNVKEKLKSIPARYFFCIQDREELPEADPILFAEDLLRDSKERAAIYMGIDFPLARGGGNRDLARKAYAMDNRNFTHLSATLNERIRTLNALGLSYPDVLQISYKINMLRLEIDNESKRRNFICAANLFPERYMRAYRLVCVGTNVHEREDPTWSEIKAVFSYTEEELLP